MSHLKRVLLVVFHSVVQQHAQRHDAAVKFTVLGSPVGVNEDGGLFREDVASFSPLPFDLFHFFPFVFLKEADTPDEAREMCF